MRTSNASYVISRKDVNYFPSSLSTITPTTSRVVRVPLTLGGTGLFLSGPGLCGPVLVARSRVPVARSRWPGPVPRPLFLPWPGGPVPVPVPVLAVCPAQVWFWWPGGPVPVPVPAPVCFDGGGPVPVPVPVPAPVARSRWPGPNKADHLCSVARFNVSRHGCAISSRNMVVLRCSPNHW